MAHITITPHPNRVKVHAGAMVLGETTAALSMVEGSYGPTLYVPRADMAMEKLVKTDRVTTCPHKGKCSYYSVITDHGPLENAVWSYEIPIAGMEAIAGHLAFYPDKITLT